MPNDNPKPFFDISADDLSEACECLLAMKQEVGPTQFFVLWVVMAAELLKLMNKVLTDHDEGPIDEVDIFRIGALALSKISDGIDVSDPSNHTFH